MSDMSDVSSEHGSDASWSLPGCTEGDASDVVSDIVSEPADEEPASEEEDGEDVVQLMVASGRRFDIVLLDEHMRRMNGSVACKALRQHEAAAGLPPTAVLVTTGNTSAGDLVKYMTSGFDGMLSKPLDLKCLATDLRSMLRARAQPGGAGAAGARWVALGASEESAGAAGAVHSAFGSIVVFGDPPAGWAAAR